MKNLHAFFCGAIQIGLMYGPYSLAFRYIKAHEVALFTMTTPLIMSALITLLTLFKEAHANRLALVRLVAAAGLATVGGLIAANNDLSSPEIAVGACLVQLSNIFFAAGLILWTRWFDRHTETLQDLMTPFFLGAMTSSMVLCAFFAESFNKPTPEQWLSLTWLGAISSGLGFFLWNKGALKVNETMLSVANNIKLPIAIVISIVVFREQARSVPLVVGVILITLGLKLGTYQPKTTQPH
jgi:drug/metabolite transporter (DMT)-like permease